MTLCLLRIGDGRDEYHERSWASAQNFLPGWDHIVTVDDRNHELGFAGAIQQGWDEVLDTGADYVFHLELDFEFLDVVPIAQMIGLLETRPYLVQVALKRQAVNPQEKEAGGIVEFRPDQFHQRHYAGYVWTEQRLFFTTNPSVYPVALCAQRWPQQEFSEGVFTHRLFDHDPLARSAFWGAKFDPPAVMHIGDERKGTGY